MQVIHRTQRSRTPVSRGLFSGIGLVVAGLLAFVPLSGCDASHGPTRSHGEGEFDHVRFVDALRGLGYTVEIGDPVSQPFLSVQGIQLKLTGANLPVTEIQSFNYDSIRAASSDAEQLGPEGSYRTMQIEWKATPHFYAKDRVIVLYVGDDAEVKALLTGVLGPPVAEG